MEKTISIRAGFETGLPEAAKSTGGLSGQYRSLTQIIVEMLRERIFTGAYEPGARLNIADLAQSFEVSPVPVREALRNLETEGLVQFHANRGVMVRELSADEVRELYLIRFRLEALAGAEAVRWATDDDIARLEAMLIEMDGLNEISEWDALHSAFHEEFYRLSQLPRLYQMVSTLRGQMRPYSRLYLGNPDHLSKARVEHFGFIEALRNRDRDTIERIMAEHLLRPARLAMEAVGGDAESSFEDFEPAA